jgi:DNA-binding GntR family transcriptional regulator
MLADESWMSVQRVSQATSKRGIPARRTAKPRVASVRGRPRDGGVRLPLNDMAYQQIKAGIVSGTLPPGESVSEAQLVEQLSLSKAPIRNALARLAQEGLVKPVPRQGYVVSPLTISDVQEVFSLRLLLEPVAARLAAGRLSESDIREMEQAIVVRYTRGDPKSEARFLQANRSFHMTVARASGNRRLADWIGQLLDEVERMLFSGLAGEPHDLRYQEEHRQLMRALVAGEAERAAQMVTEQVRGGLNMVLDNLSQSSKRRRGS